MKSGIEYALRLVDWQVFMSLTFRDPLPRSAIRERLVRQFLSDVAKWERITLLDLLAFIRWERGEQTQRPHCHVLLSALPDPSRLTRRWCLVRAKQWYRRAGLAKVKLWCPERAHGARAYLVKNLPESQRVVHLSERWCNGADFELGKSNRADRVYFSPVLWEYLQRKTSTHFEVLAHD